VGLKPTRGIVSTRGVLPACRSFDAVSIFAPDVAGAVAVLDVIAAFDPADPYRRRW
jgi:allophanate hydrolase